jgi:hypothetical protein
VISRVICVYATKRGDIKEHGICVSAVGIVLVLVYTRNAVVVLEHQMDIDRLCPKLPNHDEARCGV